MSDKDLLKDVQALIAKHGLKAGDGDDSGDDNSPAPESTNGGESHTHEADDQGSDPKVVANLADRIATKIADAIIEAKGIKNKKDQSALNYEVERTKIFSNWGGLREIAYPSDVKSLSKEEKIVTFFKALVYHRADPMSDRVLRALVEGTDSEGGYLVPDELRAEVFRIMPDMAVMRRIARVIPMSSDTLLLNSLSAAPSAYWTAEYASKSTTSAEFSQVTLNSNDLVCLLPVSEQLIADANINIVQFIIELFAEAIARGEDLAFFTGSGSGQPRGINQETLSSASVGASIDFDDILALIDLVPQSVTQSQRSAFVAHRRVKRLLRAVKDSNNNYIWRDGGATTAPGTDGQVRRLPDTLYGYPFWEQNDLNENELYFGDWGYYAIGDRQALSVRTTTEGGDAWRRNAMEIKAVERVDGRAIMTTPFAKLTDV